VDSRNTGASGVESPAFFQNFGMCSRTLYAGKHQGFESLSCFSSMGWAGCRDRGTSKDKA